MDEVLYSNTLFVIYYTTAILVFELIHLINSVFDLTLNFMLLINKTSSLAQQEIWQDTAICIHILL